MSIREWRYRGERGWTRSNMQKAWETLVATVTQFPGASIGVGAPSEREPVPPIPSLPLVLRGVLAFFLFALFFFLRGGIKTKGNSREKNRNLLHAGVFFLATPTSRETSSAKCPKKIGICCEYRIPEVRSGLSEELLKVLPSNFVFPWNVFPRIFPRPRCRRCHFVFFRQAFSTLSRCSE